MFRLTHAEMLYDSVTGDYTVNLLWLGTVDTVFTYLPQSQVVSTSAGISTATDAFVSAAYTFYGITEP